MATGTRGQILAALREAGEPATAHELANRLGLHITTARYHLDLLVAEGVAARSAVTNTGERGRPRVRYAPVARSEAQAELINALVELIERGVGGEGAAAVGEEWALSVDPGQGDAAEVIERELAVRGFAPVRTSSGFDLHACPFKDAALRAPGVVCALHLGLTRGLAARADASSVVTLEPFVTPDLCRVGLAEKVQAA